MNYVRESELSLFSAASSWPECTYVTHDMLWEREISYTKWEMGYDKFNTPTPAFILHPRSFHLSPNTKKGQHGSSWRV